MKNINKWDSLSIKDKADLMKLYIKNGINNLEEIRSHYNKFATGGYTEEDDIQKIVDKVNASKANFVERLKDPNREFIEDWASDAIATHKLGVATDNKGNHYIYPEVQKIKGKLIDFTRPPYTEWAGMKTAEERGDTVRVNSIEEGLKFTENYKKYYPTFNKFQDGGEKNTINLVLKDTSSTYNNWQEAINDSWYKPVYDNMWVGTIPYKSMYQNKDATTKLSKNTTIDNFINVMYPIVEQSMISKGKSLKNVDNMVKQIAYESNYGRSSRGNGYNLAGIKEFDSSKPRTKYKDGQYYKDFSDYRDFADYYVDLVTNRYEVENAANLKDYVDRLHGKNSSGKSYSTNKKYYRDMKNMKTLDKKIKDYKK